MQGSSSLLLSFVLLVAATLMTGCDGGGPDLDEAPPTTVAFGTSSLSALEANNPVIELPVVVHNPADSQVQVEVLFAKGASGENFTLSDLGITEPEESRAYRDDEGELVAYVVGSVTFSAGAEDGVTQTVRLPIADSTEEGQETGLFALQSVTAEQEAAIEIGEPSEVTLTVEAEGAEMLVEEDFENEAGEGELGVFTAVSVASNANWEPSSAGDASNAPYAVANGFGADEPSNDWLISPPLDFTSIADETLTFLNAKNFDDGGIERGLRVKVSTTYDGVGNPKEFEWVDISDRVENYSEGGYEFVASGEIDLSDEQFQAESVYVAFQYITSGTGGGSTELWEVDEIVVKGRTLVE